MDESAFLDKLATALEIDRSALGQPESLFNPGSWDSLAIMEVIAIIDDCYGITVPAVELAKCNTVESLLSLVRRHKLS